MISAVIKSDLKRHEKKEPLAVSCRFSQKYIPSQNLKQNVKQTCCFHLILVGIQFSLILPVKNRGIEGGGGGGGGRERLLIGENPLRVTKVICRRSLCLVTPKAKKSLDFLNNFNFTIKNLKILAKYGQLMLGTFDLTICLALYIFFLS